MQWDIKKKKVISGTDQQTEVMIWIWYLGFLVVYTLSGEPFIDISYLYVFLCMHGVVLSVSVSLHKHLHEEKWSVWSDTIKLFLYLQFILAAFTE